MSKWEKKGKRYLQGCIFCDIINMFFRCNLHKKRKNARRKEKTNMEELIKRINFLARKSREEGLSEEEKAEQAELRQRYIKAFRQGMENTMEGVYIMDKDGNKVKVEKKK